MVLCCPVDLVEGDWFRSQIQFYWKCFYFFLIWYTMQVLVVFSGASGSRCLSLVPLCSSFPPEVHYTGSYLGIRVPHCHTLIHDLGFKVRSFSSDSIFSSIRDESTRRQACSSSQSERKCFLDCSVLPLHHHFCSCPSILGVLSNILWTFGASTFTF